MKNNPVGWFEIYVQDLERAKGFYETVLGTTLSPLSDPSPEFTMLAFPMDFTATGCPGALVKMEGKDSGNGGTLIYFTCEDCAVEASRVTGAGGSVMKEKFSIGEYGHIALVHDTEGNLIGLHSMA
ncbi:MAG TPA: VOC family protein [Chthoniobacterales bacterium]|jgi:hypothetical protein